jgi:hypothetical protein
LAVRKLIGQRPHFGTAYANQLAEKSKNSAQHATTDIGANGGRGLHLALALLRHAAHHFLSHQLVFGGFGWYCFFAGAAAGADRHASEDHAGAAALELEAAPEYQVESHVVGEGVEDHQVLWVPDPGPSPAPAEG